MSIVKNWFESELPEALLSKQETLKIFNHKYKFKIMGVNEWMLDLTISPGTLNITSERGDSVLECTESDLEQMLLKPIASYDLYKQNKLILKGNTIIWDNFPRIVSITRNLESVS